jgi:two-component system KDP operon response regulator KdpE
MMQNSPLILIAEDEEIICSFISAILEANNFKVIKTAKGGEVVALTTSRCPDLILLDLGLPDMDGLDVLKALRAWTTVPVIVVSARVHEREKVEALDLGADDYITKPFGTGELLARIRTAMRHGRNNANEARSETGKLAVGDLEIDYEKRRVFVAGKEVRLTPIEYKILILLSAHIGKVLTHDFIIKKIWGPYTNDIQSLRVNMANIRRKLRENPAEPNYIVTEVGVGYRMVEEIESDGIRTV